VEDHELEVVVEAHATMPPPRSVKLYKPRHVDLPVHIQVYDLSDNDGGLRGTDGSLDILPLVDVHAFWSDLLAALREDVPIIIVVLRLWFPYINLTHCPAVDEVLPVVLVCGGAGHAEDIDHVIFKSMDDSDGLCSSEVGGRSESCNEATFSPSVEMFGRGGVTDGEEAHFIDGPSLEVNSDAGRKVVTRSVGDDLEVVENFGVLAIYTVEV